MWLGTRFSNSSTPINNEKPLNIKAANSNAVVVVDSLSKRFTTSDDEVVPIPLISL